ncbi:MAG: hypothetical protein D6766_11925, partial [Verrucomicrobia bacterium]
MLGRPGPIPVLGRVAETSDNNHQDTACHAWTARTSNGGALAPDPPIAAGGRSGSGPDARTAEHRVHLRRRLGMGGLVVSRASV